VNGIKNDVGQLVGAGQIASNLANSLLAKLDGAAAARSHSDCTAAKVYNAFINEVQAQTGMGIDQAAAAILIADAEYLIAHCP
jgi:hypothetical protein